MKKKSDLEEMIKEHLMSTAEALVPGQVKGYANMA